MIRLAAALLLAVGISACSVQSQSAPQCADGQPPKNIIAQATYVALECQSSAPVIIPINNIPGNYGSGQGALNDPFFWMWATSGYHGFNTYTAIYHRYPSFPYHTYVTHVHYYRSTPIAVRYRGSAVTVPAYSSGYGYRRGSLSVSKSSFRRR